MIKSLTALLHKARAKIPYLALGIGISLGAGVLDQGCFATGH